MLGRSSSPTQEAPSQGPGPGEPPALFDSPSLSERERDLEVGVAQTYASWTSHPASTTKQG